MTTTQAAARAICEALHGTIWAGDLEAVQPILDAACAAAVAEAREAFRAIVATHRRHVELSPGVGQDAQRYGLACLDDVASDLDVRDARTPPPGGGAR